VKGDKSKQSMIVPSDNKLSKAPDEGTFPLRQELSETEDRLRLQNARGQQQHVDEQDDRTWRDEGSDAKSKKAEEILKGNEGKLTRESKEQDGNYENLMSGREDL